MDTKVLIIILLASLVLIVGAVIAFWWRNRGSSSINERLGSAPTAPSPGRRRDEAPEQAKKEAQEPPRGQIPIPPAPASPPSASPPIFGSAPPPPMSPKPSSTGVVPPAPPPPAQAPYPAQPEPAGSYQPLPPAPKPQAPVALPATPAREEKPPAPSPAPMEEPIIGAAPEAEEDETEISAPVGGVLDDEESGILPAPEPVPALPLLDLDELPAEELADFMKEVASATPDDAEITRSGEATVNMETLGKAAQSVLFSAYYPKEIAPEKWEPLHAYIFRAMASAAVEADAGKQLGARAAEFRGVRAPAQADVAEGAMVTATPQMEGFHFNPPSLTIGFYKDWHRFDFEVRAKDAPLNQSTNGLLTFTVEGIIVADVPLSIFVGEATAASSGQANAVAKAYEAIFCSYSHQDQHIVARAERAYKALGLDYLRDVVSLKSGQDWSDELLTLINRADIFQLFWSQASAQSEHVRFEWEHALQVAGWRANFIRPVYWEDPQPSIPQELKHIHFAYQPDLGT